MQIVIAEQHDRALAQCAHKAQRLQRLRPAVDDVAYKYHPTVVRQLRPQMLQAVGAALHVADGDNHETDSTFAPTECSESGIRCITVPNEALRKQRRTLTQDTTSRRAGAAPTQSLSGRARTQSPPCARPRCARAAPRGPAPCRSRRL